jgi:hypothetical protein
VIEDEQMRKIKVAVQDLFFEASRPEFTEPYNASCQRLTPLMMEHAHLMTLMKEF